MVFFRNKEVITDRVKIITKDMIQNRNCKVCVLPDSVEVIDEEAFANCKKLEKLIFVNEEGKKVTNKIIRIKINAFYHTNLKEFTYSHYLQWIDSYAFQDTPLSVFRYQDEDNMESNLQYIRDAFCSTNITHLVVPPSVTQINANDFTSLLCKDKDGNIATKCTSFSDDFDVNAVNKFGIRILYPRLEEISLLGDSISNIQKVIKLSPNLKTIYVSANQLDGKAKLSLEGRTIHFILCGEADVLKEFVACPDYNTITVSFNEDCKVKKIEKSFLSGLANQELIIPEGVEEIEAIPYNLRNLKQLLIPSTLKKLSKPMETRSIDFLLDMDVSICANITKESYHNLWSYLSFTSTPMIQIHSNQFTQEQKEYFRELTPKYINISFVIDEKLTFENATLSAKEKPKEIPSVIEKTSTYQKKVDTVKNEILELINLLPDDLKNQIKELYNQIIEEYHNNRKLEEENILKDQLSFGVLDAASNLYTRLFLLHNQILLNYRSINKLKEIQGYRNLLNEVVEVKNDSIEDISKIVQNIQFEIQKFSSDYQKSVHEIMDAVFSHAEEKYQVNLQQDNKKPSLTLDNENTPMEDMKTELVIFLQKLETPKLQELILLDSAFEQESEDLNIESLSDHVKTINCAMKGIANRSKNEEWEQLKLKYGGLFFQEVVKVIRNTKQSDFSRLEELEKEFKITLKEFVDSAIITLNQNAWLISKLQEIREPLLVFGSSGNAEENKKDTVSSLLVNEIMELASKVENIEERYDLHKNIQAKVNKTFEKLNQEENIGMLEEIMKDFYKDLTDVWAKVYEIYEHRNSEINIQKI